MNFSNCLVFKEISATDKLPSDPLVSVVVMAYNHELYLSDAINGIVNQTIANSVELIIGEDCSTDNTRQVAIDLQRKYPEIIRVVYSEENVGAANNLQRLISLCRGKYIAICEGDDYWNDNQKLEKQTTYMESDQECVVTFHDAIYIDNQGNYLAGSKLGDKGKRNFSKEELINYSFLPTLTMCFRNVIKKLPEEFFFVINGDTFLISLLGNYGYAKYISDIEPAAYRVHEGGVWSGKPQNQKIKETIITKYWLSVYYNRINKPFVATRFACSAMSYILSTVKINKLIFFRWFLRMFFDRSYKVYKQLKKAF